MIKAFRAWDLRLAFARVAALVLVFLSTAIFIDGVIVEDGTQIFYAVIDLIFFFAFSAVAFIIITRRSDNYMVLAVGTALVMYAATGSTGFGALSQEVTRVCSSTGLLCLRAIDYWSLTIDILLFASTISVPILAYVFPDGRFIPRWTRWLTALWIAWGVSSLVFPRLNPYSWPVQYSWLLFVFGLCTGLYAQVFRYRRVSTQEQRQQTKWVAFGFAAASTGYIALPLLSAMFPFLLEPPINRIYFITATSVFFISQSIVPACIALSILRRSLWDIDVVINRTLIYMMLSGSLLLVYWASDNALEKLVSWALGTFSSLSQFSGAGSTAIVAVAVSPIHKRSEEFINRVFYRDKLHLRVVFSESAHEIRGLTDLSQVLKDVVEKTCKLLKIRYGALYLGDSVERLKLAKAQNLPSKPLALPKDKDSLCRIMNGTPVFRSDDRILPLILPLTLPSSAKEKTRGSRLVGLLALGPRGAGMGYSREDQSMLQGFRR